MITHYLLLALSLSIIPQTQYIYTLDIKPVVCYTINMNKYLDIPDHDCHASEEDGCMICEEFYEAGQFDREYLRYKEEYDEETN